MIWYYCNRCKKRVGAHNEDVLVTDYDTMYDYEGPVIETHLGNQLEDMRPRYDRAILCNECAQDFGLLISNFFRGAKITVTEDEGKDKEKNE